MRNIGVIFFLSTSAKINPSPMGFSIQNQIFTRILFYICCQMKHFMPLCGAILDSHRGSRLLTLYRCVHLCVPVCLN